MSCYPQIHLLSTLLAVLVTLGIFSIVSAVKEQSFLGRLVLCGIGGVALVVAFNI